MDRPVHVADVAGRTFAIAVDPSARLHFGSDGVGGDAPVVLLGREVSDRHLAELRDDGVSYVVAEGDDLDLGAMLDILRDRFCITRLALEGGAGINGAFLAAGLVDEISLLVAPALDGGRDVQGIVAFDDGLLGRIELSLTGSDVVDHGVVHLRYAVSVPRG